MHKTFTTTTGRKIRRLSRRIKIHNEYVTSRHSLYDYADSGDEYDGKRFLDYFTFNGRKYALGQFMRFNNGFVVDDYMFEENDKLQYLSGYDSTQWYNPLLIELDDCGEWVRVYEEVCEDENIA